MKKKICLLLLSLLCSIVSGYSQLVLADRQQGKVIFPIVFSTSDAAACYDKSDVEVVRKSVKSFVVDVERLQKNS